MTMTARLFPTLLALPLLSACEENRVPILEQTITLIGGSGGTAKSAAGELTLTVPANVLPANTEVLITTTRRQITAVHGPLFDLKTNPPIATFAQPIAVEIKNPNETIDVAVALIHQQTPMPVSGGTYDRANKIARAELTHFSTYSLVATSVCPTERPNAQDTCSRTGQTCGYGEECCCDECGPAEDCSCLSGVWMCSATQRCVGAPQNCPPSCSEPQPTCDSFLGPNSIYCCMQVMECGACYGDSVTTTTCTEDQWRCPNNYTLVGNCNGFVSPYDGGFDCDAGTPPDAN
jgi:hypothetical protein